MYPKPDLSDRPPRLQPTPEDDRVDVGWADGIMDEQRPYVVRRWMNSSWHDLAFYFAAVGLERWEPWDFAVHLEREGLISFAKEEDGWGEAPEIESQRDAQGQAILEVRFTAERQGRLIIVRHLPLRVYE